MKANFVLCQKAFGLSLQQVKLSHIQIVQWSIFLFNTQVTFTVLISSFDLKKEWKFTAFLGPGKISSEGFRSNYHLKLCVSWNKRHPGKKAKFLKIFALEWNMSFFLLKIQFHFDYVGHNIVHIQGYQNKLETGAFHCQGPVWRGGLNVLHPSFKPFQTI